MGKYRIGDNAAAQIIEVEDHLTLSHLKGILKVPPTTLLLINGRTYLDDVTLKSLNHNPNTDWISPMISPGIPLQIGPIPFPTKKIMNFAKDHPWIRITIVVIFLIVLISFLLRPFF